MVGLLLQHIAEALDLGVEVGRVGLQRPRLLGWGLRGQLLLGAGIDQRIRRLLGGRRRVDGRVVGFLGSRRRRILRRHAARARASTGGVLAPMIYRDSCFGDATRGGLSLGVGSRTRGLGKNWSSWRTWPTVVCAGPSWCARSRSTQGSVRLQTHACTSASAN